MRISDWSSDVCSSDLFLLSIGVLDDLEAVEELDDLAEGFAVVLDDLAGFALGCVLDGDDLLAGTSGTDLRGVEAEIGDGDLFDRLRLGGHDPLEGGVAGLDHADRKSTRLNSSH